jgi:hypothetical protein
MPASWRRSRGTMATAARETTRRGTWYGRSSRVNGGLMTKSIASRAQSETRSSERTASKYARISATDAGTVSAGTPSSAATRTPSPMYRSSSTGESLPA